MTDRHDDDEVTPTFSAISPARCVELLQTQTVGRVAWQAADAPEILPVTFTWHENSVIFRTSPYGPLSELASPPTLPSRSMRSTSSTARDGASWCTDGPRLSQDPTSGAAVDRSGVPWAPGVRNLFIQITPTK